MLEVENISAGYGNGDVIENLSFIAIKKEIYVLLGANGAGKTTTFRAITGILPLSSGRVVVDGIDLWVEPENAKRKMGYLPEGERVYPDLTVYKNLRFFAKIYDVEEERINELLKEFRLEKYKNTKAGYLSRGFRKRLALARALLHNPDILVLDEPFSNLDIPTALSLRDKIFEMLKEGKIILFSTHILSELQNFEGVKCRVAIMKEGKLVLEERLENLLSKVSSIEVVFKVDKKIRAKELLEKFGYNVNVENTGISVMVSRYNDEVPAIMKILLTQGINVYEVKPKETPIEKIFTGILEK
ncbi:ABC transporter [Thermococcus litoralis DSM 5473]|uniref:ABC transporter n=1 Tax=Thermococcus litoralis (strain ATCC 51850 / DSM 5473 / JCM 8560 / NS-C) TaxID=523849 RepID=H3ZQR1_THELN|nr:MULTISPECIES: ABC transporter ATP-binding protein [Thermococcus]ALV61834.1 ABC transporter, ATP-binding protein [Thermococcus sp. 2319x1]EHR77637.1 ABC transporter [Thermococcus litoralis DSM 5473]MPW38326.1 ATP-binding cassette domain-containing protein [Thermococcus sp. 101 C5]